MLVYECVCERERERGKDCVREREGLCESERVISLHIAVTGRKQ